MNHIDLIKLCKKYGNCPKCNVGTYVSNLGKTALFFCNCGWGHEAKIDEEVSNIIDKVGINIKDYSKLEESADD